MKKLKIARLEYLRTRQAELVVFAHHVINTLRDQDGYEELQPQVQQVAISVKTLSAAIAATSNRGMLETAVKNVAKEDLMEKLNQLADALEIASEGNETWLRASGFSLQTNTKTRLRQMPVPEITRATSTGKRGELRIVLNNYVGRLVRTHSIEYSLDQGETWHNGEYNSRTNFVTGGLPHSPDLRIRVRSIGFGQKVSGWSEPVRTAVL